MAIFTTMTQGLQPRRSRVADSQILTPPLPRREAGKHASVLFLSPLAGGGVHGAAAEAAPGTVPRVPCFQVSNQAPSTCSLTQFMFILQFRFSIDYQQVTVVVVIADCLSLLLNDPIFEAPVIADETKKVAVQKQHDAPEEAFGNCAGRMSCTRYELTPAEIPQCASS